MSRTLPQLPRYSKRVDNISRDISRAVGEAIEKVAMPAAEAAEGSPISDAMYLQHGKREESYSADNRVTNVEFFWRDQTVALLVVELSPEGGVLIECQAGTHFETEEEKK